MDSRRLGLRRTDSLHFCRRHYKEMHPPGTRDGMMADVAKNEFGALCQGNPMGRVFRVMATEAVAVRDQPDLRSEVVGYVQPGKLVVAFDDPGPFREVNTADWTFGYIPRSVELQAVPELIPLEVYDERSRADAEVSFLPLGAAGTLLPAAGKRTGLSPMQIFVALLFGIAMFVGVLSLLVRFGG